MDEKTIQDIRIEQRIFRMPGYAVGILSIST